MTLWPNIFRIRTNVPGPRSQQLKKELNKFQEMSSVTFFADYDKSFGELNDDECVSIIEVRRHIDEEKTLSNYF